MVNIIVLIDVIIFKYFYRNSYEKKKINISISLLIYSLRMICHAQLFPSLSFYFPLLKRGGVGVKKIR